MKVILDKKYPDMYRIDFEDSSPDGNNGTISVRSDNPPVDMGPYGMYNKTRALEIVRLIENQELEVGVVYDVLPSTL